MNARTWARRNLFRSVPDGVCTIVFGALGLFLLYKTLNYVFFTGRWTIIQDNLKLLMVGRFPVAHLPRLAVSAIVLAGWAGFLAGFVRGRQIRDGKAPAHVSLARRVRAALGRIWLPCTVILLLLLLSTTIGPWLTALGAAAAALAGWLIGPLVGKRRLGRAGATILVLAVAATPLVLYFYIVTAVGFDGWGGFYLNLYLALVSIVLCYPLGVLLALGRRSKLPLIQTISIVYIEAIRGAPLFVLLLLANTALQFFVPADVAPSKPARAIVVFTLFTAAYMAEIIRGGLQSVPRGQFEAARALGLSPTRQTGLIILPQALRNVIPAQIGQLISLFKDTVLAGVAMGLFELLEVADAITQQGDFRGQRLSPEVLAFSGLLFWTVAYTMSRESQRLERRLGVGTR